MLFSASLGFRVQGGDIGFPPFKPTRAQLSKPETRFPNPEKPNPNRKLGSKIMQVRAKMWEIHKNRISKAGEFSVACWDPSSSG